MNRKAFTMVELIAIITIIGVILIFALPNVTSTIERNKKDVMINDAKDFLDKTKIYIFAHQKNKDKCSNASYKNSNKGECRCIKDNVCLLSVVDPREEIKNSPFGKKYDRTGENSFVNPSTGKITLKEENGGYKIVGRTIENLNSDHKYEYVTK